MGEFLPAPVAISTAIESRLSDQLKQHWHLIAGFLLSVVGIFFVVNLTLLNPMRGLAKAVHELGDEVELSDPEAIPYIRSRTEVGEVARAFVSVLEEVRLKAKTLSSKFFEQQEHRRQANIILEQERQLWPVIAHEIRSPVHTLMRDLEKEGTDDAIIRIRFLRRVETAMEVVEKLRSGERIESPSAAIDLNEYCLAWASNADDRFQPIAVARAEFPVWVRVAVELIDMILENLASNAIRHRHPDDSPLLLRVDAKDGQAILHFINSGDPIPDDRVPFLFDLHYSDGPRRTKQNRGIGLFISRHYARLMGGSLTYLPTPDVATFELLIPLDIASLGSTPSLSEQSHKGEDVGDSFADV